MMNEIEFFSTVKLKSVDGLSKEWVSPFVCDKFDNLWQLITHYQKHDLDFEDVKKIIKFHMDEINHQLSNWFVDAIEDKFFNNKSSTHMLKIAALYFEFLDKFNTPKIIAVEYNDYYKVTHTEYIQCSTIKDFMENAIEHDYESIVDGTVSYKILKYKII